MAHFEQFRRLLPQQVAVKIHQALALLQQGLGRQIVHRPKTAPFQNPLRPLCTARPKVATPGMRLPRLER
ncbi:MAG: hypothetical protein NZM43_06425 [Saprospiraceae bacterium]|nr:hypothetical protein [Saprospiraceae bacterium]MDW8483947.1 hypothetical protein [Saprospiraceae bacterium]